MKTKIFLLSILMSSISLMIFGQNQILNGGNTFSSELCSNSAVYTMGSNNVGQMGQGTTSTGLFTSPVSVPGLPSNLKMVSAGSGSHAAAVDCNGSVWTWGLNNCGQLGHSTVAIIQSTNSTQVGPPNGSPGSCSYSSGWGPVASVPGLPPIVLVNGGNLATYAIASVTGQVWAWGMNESGQLGNNTNYTDSYIPSQVKDCSGNILSNIVQVSSGDWSVYALDANGYVWSWGVNTNGSGYLSYGGFASKGQELGRYTGCNLAGEKVNCAGKVQADYNGDGIPDGDLKNIIQITAGDTHGLAIDNTGGLWAWGSDWTGQTGNGSAGLYCGTCSGAFPSFAMRVPLPGSPAIAAYSPNCGSYGTNTLSGYFIGGTSTTPGVTIPKAVYIAAGQSSSAAVLDNGKVVTFGLNSQSGIASGCNYGTLGTGSNSTTAAVWAPQYVLTSATTTLTGIATLSRGDGWYYAQNLAGTTIYTWGVNNYGQLGNGSTSCIDYATTITLPTGCNYVSPCPPKPFLGGDVTMCPNYTFSSNVTPISSYLYTWQYRSVTTAGWNTIATGSGYAFSTLSGTNIGQYRLLVSDNRSGNAIICGTCPTQGDTASILAPPCSTTPNLGGSLQVCQPVSQVLNSGLSGSNIIFEWSYSSSSSTTGWSILTTAAGLSSYTATGLGYYRVRTINSLVCLGCIPSAYSTIQLTTAPSVFNAGPSTLCTTVSGSGVFSITTTAGGGSYFWYTNPTGGTSLNTTPGLSISGVSVGQTNTLTGCSGRVLYVQDQSSIQGTLDPSTTCSAPSGVGGGFNVLIQPSRNISLTSVLLMMPTQSYSQTYNLTFSVYSSNSNNWCASCSANIWDKPGSVLSTSTAQYIMPGSASGSYYQYTMSLSGLNLSANTKYWVSINSSIQLGLWQSCTYTNNGGCASVAPCNFGTPYWDNTGNNVVGVYGIQNNGNSTSNVDIKNITFSAGNVSACTRIPVCATATCPLSVSYADLNATKVSNTVIVNWSTFTEENASRFVVERSYDGTTFDAIGTVPAKGNSSHLNNYQFVDVKPGRGTIYYRIVEYDLDNSYTVSKIASVNMTSFTDFTIIPNPNNGNFTIQANLNSPSNFTIQTTNSLGVVISSTLESSSGAFSKDLDFSSLSAGVYFVSFKAGDDIIVKKVVIEK